MRIKTTITTVGSNGSAIGQSDTFLVNGYLAGVRAIPGNGQATTLDIVVRGDQGVLLTSANISADTYDTDGTELRTIAERYVNGALSVQAAQGNSAKTVEVWLDILEDLP